VAIQKGASMFGGWNSSGAWNLEFEASQPSHSAENSKLGQFAVDDMRTGRRRNQPVAILLFKIFRHVLVLNVG
jgi:hypothetical protein